MGSPSFAPSPASRPISALLDRCPNESHVLRRIRRPQPLAHRPELPCFRTRRSHNPSELRRGRDDRARADIQAEIYSNAPAFVLHTADISRNQNGFERLKDPDFRERFYAELNDLMSGLEYQVVACVIRKDAHLARYGLAALDPYQVAGKKPGGLPPRGRAALQRRVRALDAMRALAPARLQLP